MKYTHLILIKLTFSGSFTSKAKAPLYNLTVDGLNNHSTDNHNNYYYHTLLHNKQFQFDYM